MNISHLLIPKIYLCDTYVGKSSFPAVQAAPSFSSSFPIILKGLSVYCYCLILLYILKDSTCRVYTTIAYMNKYPNNVMYLHMYTKLYKYTHMNSYKYTRKYI